MYHEICEVYSPNAEDKKVDVPLDWVQIDSIIVGMRMLASASVFEEKFVEEFNKYLEPYCRKAKGYED